MTLLTPEQASTKWLCPNSRIFGSKEVTANCQGAKCAAWRFEKIMAGHPKWSAAVRALAAEADEKAPFPKAARAVADDPAKHGLIPERGYCGLGGQP